PRQGRPARGRKTGARIRPPETAPETGRRRVIETLIDIVLLTFLAITAIAMVRQNNLFAVAMLTGIYSLLSAGIFMVMDAVDVAFTEASVGAGITTILIVATLALVGHRETRREPVHWRSLLVVTVTGVALIYGTRDMPHYGDPNAPVHQHVANRYIQKSPGHDGEVGPPNMVTSVLASYRGFDTLGETAVVFTAAVAVLMLLGAGDIRRIKEEAAE
ncbi:MAG: DUF4040 domain-containing protein, partial [Verrucomicrobiota bacterium]